MSPADRRRLIERPFIITRAPASYRWAGVHIEDTVPTDGRRVWTVTPEDEEAYNLHVVESR